jgi:hypothetical protein
MVCCDVMSFDSLLSINLSLLISISGSKPSITFTTPLPVAAARLGSRATRRPLPNRHALGLPKRGSMPARKQRGRQYVCTAWKPTIGSQKRTNHTGEGKKVSLPPSRRRLRSHTPADSCVVLRCVCFALYSVCCAALHCIIVQLRARAKVRSRFPSTVWW